MKYSLIIAAFCLVSSAEAIRYRPYKPAPVEEKDEHIPDEADIGTAEAMESLKEAEKELKHTMATPPSDRPVEIKMAPNIQEE